MLIRVFHSGLFSLSSIFGLHKPVIKRPFHIDNGTRTRPVTQLSQTFFYVNMTTSFVSQSADEWTANFPVATGWPWSRFSNTDRLSSVNKMFIIWQKQEQFNSFNATDLYWHFACERWIEILPKFARPLYFLFSSVFWHFQIYIVRWK